MSGEGPASLQGFCCPVCKGPLAVEAAALQCVPCGRCYAIGGEIPDFLFVEGEQDAIDGSNQTWLDPTIVEARDTVYKLCAPGVRYTANRVGDPARLRKCGASRVAVWAGPDRGGKASSPKGALAAGRPRRRLREGCRGCRGIWDWR
jgi:uncharacterized protein YbaR (Trm112 family)